jgi:hypothetical protein
MSETTEDNQITPKIETKQTLDRAAEEKARSDKYIQELRRVIQTRVRHDDGSLGEPGALPQEELVKHYKGEPLDVKDDEG